MYQLIMEKKYELAIALYCAILFSGVVTITTLGMLVK